MPNRRTVASMKVMAQATKNPRRRSGGPPPGAGLVRAIRASTLRANGSRRCRATRCAYEEGAHRGRVVVLAREPTFSALAPIDRSSELHPRGRHKRRAESQDSQNRRTGSSSGDAVLGHSVSRSSTHLGGLAVLPTFRDVRSPAQDTDLSASGAIAAERRRGAPIVRLSATIGSTDELAHRHSAFRAVGPAACEDAEAWQGTACDGVEWECPPIPSW